MKPPSKRAPLPTREQILAFIEESPGPVGKREIARAFKVAPEDRDHLRDLLKGLDRSGRQKAPPTRLPEVAVIEVTGTDGDGELVARPLAWSGEGAPPRIFVAPFRAGQEAAGIGDHLLARLKPIRPGFYEARIVKRVTTGPARTLGVIVATGTGGFRLSPTDRRQKAEFNLAAGDLNDAAAGELVLAEILPGRVHGLKPARVVERLGDMNDPRAISLVAIHTHDIPSEFPLEALAQAEAATSAPLGARQDLRKVPLVTIDGADARDFDDAVWAEPYQGGWRLIVAIADVAWYVRPSDALDREAYKRGNSVYFPDRVVPMLPEALSNGWCSLKPDEDRSCLFVTITIDKVGQKIGHAFGRGLMRSAARLTYEQVEDALDGRFDETTGPLAETVIKPLHGAWQALFAERKRRGVLELDLPERKVILDETGRIAKVVPRAQLRSHRLIEDFMIAANVAAAEEIESLGLPCLYRVHDKPAPEKLAGLQDFLASFDIPFALGQVIRADAFNAILAKAKDLPEAPLVNEVVLRAQAQAVYTPENIGHFGLGLARYAHFTSPIRRYADLMVHRALIAGLKLGAGGLGEGEPRDFAEAGEHVSATERRAAAAERDALDRFTAAFLKDKVGARFPARVNGVTRFGLFVTLDETGADGLVPVSTLPADYYVHDERRHSLTGRRYGATFTLGDAVEVILAEASPLTGGLVFRLGHGGEPKPDRPGKGRSFTPERRHKPKQRRHR